MNSSRGLSPFSMVDLTEEDVELMQQKNKDLLNAPLVSTSELKSNHTKLIVSTPTDSEIFMIILKIFVNLLFSLFSSSFPFYKKVYAIIKSLRE